MYNYFRRLVNAIREIVAPSNFSMVYMGLNEGNVALRPLPKWSLIHKGRKGVTTSEMFKSYIASVSANVKEMFKGPKMIIISIWTQDFHYVNVTAILLTLSFMSNWTPLVTLTAQSNIYISYSFQIWVPRLLLLIFFSNLTINLLLVYFWLNSV